LSFLSNADFPLFSLFRARIFVTFPSAFENTEMLPASRMLPAISIQSRGGLPSWFAEKVLDNAISRWLVNEQASLLIKWQDFIIITFLITDERSRGMFKRRRLYKTLMIVALVVFLIIRDSFSNAGSLYQRG